MLRYGHSYFIINRDEEMIYKKSSKKSVFETFSHKRKYNMESIIYKDFDNHNISELYNFDDIMYKCISIDIYNEFVYELDQLNGNHVSCYVKGDNIKLINNYNENKTIDISNLILLNNKFIKKNIDKLILKNINGLIKFQDKIQDCLFLHKNSINNVDQILNIKLFIKYTQQLPKFNKDFYVFRKQRLSKTYDPFYQFNTGENEVYQVPFSTSTSYDFVKNWSGNGLILIIKVLKDSNYMVLNDQTQNEITLGPGNLTYKEKGFFNNQPIILCNFTDL
jgi:hypothetical protein